MSSIPANDSESKWLPTSSRGARLDGRKRDAKTLADFYAATGVGVISSAPEALGFMTDQRSFPTADALDALVAQLLDCGGALSQMIAGMQEFEASGQSSPDAPPILEVAHSLICDVNAELAERHTERELRVSAEIIEEVTTAICENIFFVPPSEVRRWSGGSGSAGSRRRQRRRPGRRKH